MRTALLALAVAWIWVLVIVHATLGDLGPVSAAFHAMTGWWACLAPVVWVACAVGRRWRLAALALIPLAASVAWVAPGTTWAHRPPEGPAIDLVSANVLMVNRDPAALLAEVFSSSPDLVVLQEYSPAFAAVAEPFRLTHPYGIERPEAHSFGQAVFSRLPLEDVEESDLAGVRMLAVTVRVDGRPLRVWVVHTLPPISAENVAAWRSQLREVARRAADEDGALVIAGDLNATRHHPSYRTLLRDGGLRDAHAEVGRAAASTWPNGLFPFPPLRLDHVLLHGEVYAERIAEGRGSGSDHRPVIARLRLP